MNYFANFNANNGTRLMTDLQGTNKNKLMNAIRKQAIAECFEGSQAIWWVCDRKGHYMFSGMVYKKKMAKLISLVTNIKKIDRYENKRKLVK